MHSFDRRFAADVLLRNGFGAGGFKCDGRESTQPALDAFPSIETRMTRRRAPDSSTTSRRSPPSSYLPGSRNALTRTDVIEPPRVCLRLQILRDWSHDQANEATEASATATTMRSPRRSMGSTKQKSSGGAGHGGRWRRSNTRRSNMSRLVQQPPPARTHRQHPASPSRGRLLRKTGGTNRSRRLTQTTQPPANPGRFTSESEKFVPQFIPQNERSDTSDPKGLADGIEV